jgi:hypothetical protein
MSIWATKSPLCEEALNLSGMIYCSFSYTPEQWITKVGVDPRRFPQWFRVTSLNLVGVTDQFRNDLAIHDRLHKMRYATLGVLA